MRSFVWSVLFGGCVGATDAEKPVDVEDSAGSVDADGDGDGASGDDDCDDDDPTVHVGAEELCDGIDQDCDGEVDEGATGDTTWYADTDDDGYGDDGATTTSCVAPEGYVAAGEDCDDSDAAVHPGAEESCDATIDQNCDGSTGYTDADGDGWAACLECDDADPGANPGAAEVCDDADVDEDCSGAADDADAGATGQSTWYRDFDGDGWAEGSEASLTQCDMPSGYTAATGDCDVYDAAVSPDATEVCDPDDVDEDCDGAADDADASVDGATWSSFYADDDADGYGAGSGITACDAPAGMVSNAEDCDDGDDTVNPAAVEVCDGTGVDEDCDGSVDDADEGVTGTSTWYADADGDGYGDPEVALDACERVSGYVANALDCDDARADVSPAGSEVCDAANADEDCDGTADDADASATGETTWYRDADLDGYGIPTWTTAACDAPAGFAAYDTDCDDTAALTNPGATEACDDANADEDCDGAVDDADASAVGQDTWYLDADGDGWGVTSSARTVCDQPSGYVVRGDDCDDTNAGISPAATEVCDASDTDEDCDGAADDADTNTPSGTTAWYPDGDGDGYGTSASSRVQCNAPSGYVSLATDCDDAQASIHPGATEVCDASDTDEDCDGAADDADAGVVGRPTWYADADGDGYGLSSSTTTTCDMPGGYSASAGDCNEASAAINPGATEVCDAADVDEDCDGAADDSDTSVTGTTTWYRDVDSDGYGGTVTTRARCSQPSGYSAYGTDCNDASSAISPGATEICDASNTDEDCDSLADDADGSATGQSTWHRDADSDGYGSITSTSDTCDRPSGYLADGSDCNDGSSSIYPGAAETCDGVDQDCDTSVDDGLTLYFPDYDSDGYGDEIEEGVCTPFSPSATVGGDCDELDDTINPGAAETCNSVDDDCDGYTDDDDDSLAEPVWYDDLDGDGFGDDAGDGFVACVAPADTVSDATDCDDDDPDISPDGAEVCDDVDNDCDTLVDDDDPDTVGDTVFYVDADLDGYGDPDTTTLACEEGTGYSADDSDCDDGDGAVNPGETELYGDSVDDDCDNVTEPTVSCPSGAKTVCSSGCNYSSMSSAFSGAATGSTICINASTWTENVHYTGSKSFTVQGRGRDDTTLSGYWYLEPSSTGSITVQHVHFTGSYSTKASVYITDYSSTSDTTVRLKDCQIDATYNGVWIERQSSGELSAQVAGCDIDAGSSYAGVYAYDSSGGDYTWIQVENNYLHGSGYGVNMDMDGSYAYFYVNNNTIVGNGYGVIANESTSSSSHFYLLDNILVDNSTYGVWYLLDSRYVTKNTGYNILYDNGSNYGTYVTRPSTDILSDPLLDYSYSPPRPDPVSSPALNAGYYTSAYMESTDYWGVSRDSYPDIGCVE